MQNGRGCYRLAEQYEKGRGVKADIVRARELYKKAFGLLGATCPSSGPSCYLLGLAYNRGAGTVASAAKAFTAFESGCSAGSGEACFELGKAYFWGDGIKTDKVKAVVYYDCSCWQYDYALGCHDAGVTLVQGGEVPIDNARAQRFGDRACELDKQQCELRAYLIATGPEPRDEAAAASWYRVACENGNATGCYACAGLAPGQRPRRGQGPGRRAGRLRARLRRRPRGGVPAPGAGALQRRVDGAQGHGSTRSRRSASSRVPVMAGTPRAATGPATWPRRARAWPRFMTRWRCAPTPRAARWSAARRARRSGAWRRRRAAASRPRRRASGGEGVQPARPGLVREPRPPLLTRN